ncbi:MAG: proteasome subunit beta [Promethearchaeota archaeon Loki_b31]|nr:MAG: proteasome subunit beta [Candidatus Lokiarchaeota archaeon Loki_b31]
MRKEDLIIPSKSVFSRDSDIITNNSQKFKTQTFKTGTTTVGLVVKDAVILGTDKRASMGYFVSSKTAEKLLMIQEHLYMTIAGGVADAQYLIDVLRAETSLYQLKREKTIKVKSAGKLLSNILYQNKMYPFQVGLILGGVTEVEGPTLLNIGAYGSILPDKFCAVGSGQNFSYGVLEAKYKDNLTIKEGKQILIKAISSSIIRDMASGNGIDIAIVKKEGEAERDFISIKR